MWVTLLNLIHVLSSADFGKKGPLSNSLKVGPVRGNRCCHYLNSGSVLCIVSPLSSRSPWHPLHPTVGLLRELNHQVILFVATVNLLLAEFTTGSGKCLGKGENGMRLIFVQRPLGCTRAQWPSQHCAPCPEGHHHLVFCSVGGYCRELWAAVCPAAWWQGLAVGHGMCEFRLGLFSLGFAAVNCVKH